MQYQNKSRWNRSSMGRKQSNGILTQTHLTLDARTWQCQRLNVECKNTMIKTLNV